MDLGSHRRAVNIVGVVLGVVVASVHTPAAWAQDRPNDREARELEAKRACLANRPDQGIDILAALYTETNDPTYLYNQGRCFEQNGRAQDAVNRFREYLRKAPNLPADEQAQVQARIGELEQQLRQSAPTAQATEAPEGSKPSDQQTNAVATDDSRAADDVRSHRLRLAGIVTGGVGVAALAGGLFMGWRAKSLSDEVTTDAAKEMYSRSKDQSGQRAETLQWIGYGVGAAALIGGALLYYVGAQRDTAPAQAPGAALVPMVMPGHGGAAFRMRF